ncbi:response regulator transcription factor [Streptomyces erythrochromogenes]|uniref:response regulator transcription factor n=1 Tax=Streptomyces erythrochromogenes TaxID=285574 RepID=UPI00342DBFA7
MIRVLLADDEHLILGAVAALLSLEDDLEIVATASTGTEAVTAAEEHRPDVAVLDLQMPGKDGIAAATAINRVLPGCKLLIVTSHGLPGHLKRALEAGLHGFLPKSVAAQELAGIIRRVYSGQRHIDSELASDAISAGDSPLTAREADLLALAADGVPVAEIADRAALSEGTVRNYLSSATTKLGARNRYEAVHLARESGWI